MQFLRTLFWVVIAAFVAIIASNNWSDVTLNLWGNLQADIKIPVLLLITFLIGFLPTWLIMRGKLWRVRRRLAQEDVKAVPAAPAAAPPPAEDGL
jgi:putative membrane protein